MVRWIQIRDADIEDPMDTEIGDTYGLDTELTTFIDYSIYDKF